MKTAKIFRSGNSQAVRIPKEFQLQGDEVDIERKGEVLLLRTAEAGQAAASFFTRRERRFASAWARSYCNCWLSQLSALVPREIDRRTAISGLIPDRPLRMLDRVFRLMPSAAAASVTLRRRGCRHNSRRTSPG
jgi:virulence-associated protein VagC